MSPVSTHSNAKEDLIQEQILQAAKRLFAVHGLAKVTMDDVAKAIGKGRSSLYYYYKNKEEILDAVMEMEIREMLNAMGKAVMDAVTAETKLQAFCTAKLKMLHQKREFFKMLDIGMDADTFSQFHKTQVVRHRQIMRQEGELLQQLLHDATVNGELRSIAINELDTLIFVILSSLHGIKREMVMDNDFSKIEVAAKALCSLIINGLKN